MSLKLGLDELKQMPDLIGQGLTNAEIAFYFNCCLKTVKRGIRRLKDAGYELPKRKAGRPFKKYNNVSTVNKG